MTDLSSLKQAARVVEDEAGNPVVQIPLSLWQEWLAQLESEGSQVSRITTLLHSWEEEPVNPEWWDEFRRFLSENRLNFEDNSLGN